MCSMGTERRHTIAVIPGDGVGPELVRQAVKVFRTLEKRSEARFQLKILEACGASVDTVGEPLTKEAERKALECEAVLIGNIGARKYQALPQDKRPEQALMRLRQSLRVCTNLRPVTLFPGWAECSPLKESIIRDGFDILMVRDLSGGMLACRHRYGMGGEGREASDLEYYNEMAIARTAHVAFDHALRRRRTIASLDKANVLASSALWRQKVQELSGQYSEVTVEHRYVDTAAMDVIREPGSFDVILTSNAYGDIIADELAQLSGTPCFFGSAELAPDGRGIYTPNQLHNPNEDFAGKGLACPVCIFSAVAMMLRCSLGEEGLAQRVEKGMEVLLQAHCAAGELFLPGDTLLTTEELGDRFCEILLEQQKETF